MSSFNSEGEEEIRFQTFLNYLRQYKLYIENEIGDDRSLAESIWKQSSKTQGAGTFTGEYIERSLYLAWNTETIACNFGLKEPEALKINNHWKPIQVYYGIYSAAEALAHLLTNKERYSHKECLRTVSEHLVRLKLVPWGFGFSGKDGKNRDAMVRHNFPSDLKFEHNLKINDVRPLDVLATCLQAEHRKRRDDAYKERRSNKKKGQTRTFKYDLDPGCTTLLHFAYRLRLRSNYEGAEMYMAQLSDKQIRDFDDLLNGFCVSTLMLLEILIIRKITKKEFIRIYESFNKKVRYNGTLGKRIQIYRELK